VKITDFSLVLCSTLVLFTFHFVPPQLTGRSHSFWVQYPCQNPFNIWCIEPSHPLYFFLFW